MAKVDSGAIAAVKALFETGDTLTEQGFSDLIDLIADAAEAHQHLSTGGDGTGTGDAGPVINLQSGTAAQKPGSPAVGDVYVETDTSKMYACYSAGVWTETGGAGEGGQAGLVDITLTAGEDLSTEDCVYIEPTGGERTPGRCYKTDANVAGYSSNAWIVGFVTAAALQGDDVTIRIAGKLDGFTGLTAGDIYYCSTTPGEITTTEPGNSRQVAVAVSPTEILVNSQGANIGVTPYVKVATKGYFAGGYTGSSTATTDKITFATDSTASCGSANLSQARRRLAGVSEGDTKGYVAGGETASYTSLTDKIVYATDATSYCGSANLSQARFQLAGVSGGSAKGYFAGGYTSTAVNTTDKITYATDTTSRCTSADLSTVRRSIAGVSEGDTKGYVGGGMPTSYKQVTDKIVFATDTTSRCTSADLSSPKLAYAGVSGEGTKGYFAGGYQTSATDKIVYATDTTSYCSSANLSLARDDVAGVTQAQTKGYAAGGKPLAPSAVTDKITYATDTTSYCSSANLSLARSGPAGLSNIAL